MLFDLGLFNLLAFVKDDAEGLQCLAETHIVAESAIQIVLAQLGHPVDPFFLIVSELDSRVALHWDDYFVL